MRGAEEPYNSRSRHPRRKDLVTGPCNVQRTPHSGDVRGTLRGAQRVNSGHIFTIAGNPGKASRALCRGEFRTDAASWRRQFREADAACAHQTCVYMFDGFENPRKAHREDNEAPAAYTPDMNASKTNGPSDPTEGRVHRRAGEAVAPVGRRRRRSASTGGSGTQIRGRSGRTSVVTAAHITPPSRSRMTRSATSL